MSRPVAQVRNLGPATAAWLAEIGVVTEGDLRALGAAAAYLLLKAARPGVSLNALYAMEAGLEGVDWRALDPERKRALRAAVAFDGTDLGQDGF